MIRRLASAGLALALLVTPAIATGPDFSAMQVQLYDPPKPAPDFVLPDLNGKMVGLAGLRGKVVFLFFWATTWLDCREELPPVNKLYSEFKSKGLEVLLVSFREDPALVKRTVQERGYVAPVLLDQSGKVTGEVYGVWGTPTTYFIDRRGRLIGRVVGPRGWGRPEARQFVQALLEADAKP